MTNGLVEFKNGLGDTVGEGSSVKPKAETAVTLGVVRAVLMAIES